MLAQSLLQTTMRAFTDGFSVYLPWIHFQHQQGPLLSFECLCRHNSCWNLMLIVMELGGGALGAPRNGISALCPREIPHPFCHVRFQQTAVYQPSRSSLETESAWHPHLLELPTSRIVRHKFLLSVTHPVSGVLFRQCKGTKSPP